MNSLNHFAIQAFAEHVRLNPYWSTYTCFYETVKGKNLSEHTIRKYFDRFVDKDDYEVRDKKAILLHLYKS